MNIFLDNYKIYNCYHHHTGRIFLITVHILDFIYQIFIEINYIYIVALENKYRKTKYIFPFTSVYIAIDV